MSLADTRIAVVGATGVVGIETLKLLHERGVPADAVVACASARRVGQSIGYGNGIATLVSIEDACAAGCGIAIFAAISDIARQWGPRFLEAGAVVVDNSSAFRMDPSSALVVPEVNGGDAAGDLAPRIIANPNCSTIIMLVAVNTIRTRFGCTRLDVCTYQAASGAGLAAMEELESQTAAVLRGEAAEPRVFPEPCAFNVFSHNSAVDIDTGLNVEEQKMIDEARKIWRQPDLAVHPTCVRVPVLRTHCEAITMELAEAATESQVRELLAESPGVEVVDDRAGGVFPTSLRAANRAPVLVGRIRPDHTRPGETTGTYRAFSMFVAGDQILKGAALNAVQIAELVVG